jgi:hypothetical protein
MKRGLVKAACTAVVFIFSLFAAKAQSYHYLTVNDFQGSPEHGGNTIAHTHCYIDLKYDVSKKRGYYELHFYVTLEMNKEQSWIDHSRITSHAMLEEILKHEQGHYTIAYFEQQELLREFSRTRFAEDYESVVKAIFDRIHEKYRRLTLDYDEDTAHSMNRIQQASWDKYFDKRLAYMPPVASAN